MYLFFLIIYTIWGVSCKHASNICEWVRCTLKIRTVSVYIEQNSYTPATTMASLKKTSVGAYFYLKLFLCLPPSVTGEGYCFPRGQLIFSFDRHIYYIISKVFESILRNRFRLSVCTTIFKLLAGLCFYVKCVMLCINGFVDTSSTN